jgi:KUP system potassium uptake protein
VTTTLLFFAIVRMRWHKPVWIVLPGAAAFLVIDLTFFSANLTKVASGGCFPHTVGLAIFTVLTTWQRRRRLVTAKRSEAEGLLSDFIDEIGTMDPPPYRAPGTAVCLSAGKQTTPLALRDNLQYKRVRSPSNRVPCFAGGMVMARIGTQSLLDPVPAHHPCGW